MDDFTPPEEKERLFSNPDSLNPDFVPRIMPYREGEQKAVAEVATLLGRGLGPKNLLVYGAPGVGKTHAVASVLEELNESESGVHGAYVNAWTAGSAEKTLEAVARQLNYRVPAGTAPSLQELAEVISQRAQARGGVVLVIDEVDQAKDTGFLYALLEGAKKTSLVLISNKSNWLAWADERIKSRLQAHELEFGAYTRDEMEGILRERKKYAFFDNTWEKEAIGKVAKAAFEAKDVRVGIRLLKDAGTQAELEGAKRVTRAHVEKAAKKKE